VYHLRKAPRKELYWVVTKATGNKHSIEPLPLKKAEAQMRALYARERPLRKGGSKGRTESEEELRKILDAYSKGEKYPPSPAPRTPPPKKRKSPPSQKKQYEQAKGRGGSDEEIIQVAKSSDSFPEVLNDPESYISKDDVKDIEYSGSGLLNLLKPHSSPKPSRKINISPEGKNVIKNISKIGSFLGDLLSKDYSASGGSYYPEQYKTEPITIRKPTGWKSPDVLKLTKNRALEKSKLDESTRRALGYISRGTIV